MKTLSRLTTALLLAGIASLSVACGEDKTAENGATTTKSTERAANPTGANDNSDTATKSGERPEPTDPMTKTDAEWKKELTPEQYEILRKHGTERAFGKAYDEFKDQGSGTYYCAGCDAKLFTSEHKFDARCGWPAFYDVASNKNIKSIEDFSAGMKRVEVRCAKCDGHLGHIFEGEGFNTPTDQRYCINGTVLRFVPDKEKKKEEKE